MNKNTTKRFTLAKIGTGLAAAVAAGAASAGELAEAAVGAMDKTELTAIGVGVLILCGVVAIIKSGKRAAG
ncbi:hypothetical protein JH271_10835 [Xanthomonas campestris pv. campestris]|uniref:hypothetical protein n=1 Tax=Xanthomonas campestris TaxID=339 RepID=UPI00237931F4|nr:hypothetical protein [Xanthomonas campestris]WDK64794.1 hypothetical protein JH271_10835 [Xanthomonas campestris pv. campestris]WDK68839.1 hypothetical protein JH258_10855 [Xanthomonas campestris pv. campestris]WDK72709.1 hypothetical protein JH284_10035 [Xanthomonas campestris pv. campestris]WDK76914.1 hypothetical protein JH294_10855 [Xanthomonas campestris pv. campestris]WDL40544.1 hypothetical protein JH292_10645 [Xanthomonas campestris pv. campestris]